MPFRESSAVARKCANDKAAAATGKPAAITIEEKGPVAPPVRKDVGKERVWQSDEARSAKRRRVAELCQSNSVKRPKPPPDTKRGQGSKVSKTPALHALRAISVVAAPLRPTAPQIIFTWTDDCSPDQGPGPPPLPEPPPPEPSPTPYPVFKEKTTFQDRIRSFEAALEKTVAPQARADVTEKQITIKPSTLLLAEWCSDLAVNDDPASLRQFQSCRDVVQELRTWLLARLSQTPALSPAAVICGPSGCGKSTAIRLLAAEQEAAVEWLDSSSRVKSIDSQLRTSMFQKDDIRFGSATKKNKKKIVVIDDADGIADPKALQRIVSLITENEYLDKDQPEMTVKKTKHNATLYESWPVVLIFGADSESWEKLRLFKQARCHIFRFKPFWSSTMHGIAIKALELNRKQMANDAVSLLVQWANGNAFALLNAMRWLFSVPAPKLVNRQTVHRLVFSGDVRGNIFELCNLLFNSRAYPPDLKDEVHQSLESDAKQRKNNIIGPATRKEARLRQMLADIDPEMLARWFAQNYPNIPFPPMPKPETRSARMVRDNELENAEKAEFASRALSDADLFTRSQRQNPDRSDASFSEIRSLIGPYRATLVLRRPFGTREMGRLVPPAKTTHETSFNLSEEAQVLKMTLAQINMQVQRLQGWQGWLQKGVIPPDLPELPRLYAAEYQNIETTLDELEVALQECQRQIRFIKQDEVQQIAAQVKAVRQSFHELIHIKLC